MVWNCSIRSYTIETAELLGAKPGSYMVDQMNAVSIVVRSQARVMVERSKTTLGYNQKSSRREVPRQVESIAANQDEGRKHRN